MHALDFQGTDRALRLVVEVFQLEMSFAKLISSSCGAIICLRTFVARVPVPARDEYRVDLSVHADFASLFPLKFALFLRLARHDRLLLFKIHLGLLCLAVFLVVAGLLELAPLAVHRLVVVLVATIFMFVLLSLEFGLKAASESKYDDEDGNNR